MKYCLALFFGIALTGNLQAQQPAQYATYMLDPLRYNPAYAGLDYALSVTGTYRQQWSGLDGAPTGQRLSAHLPLYFLKGGFGIQVENDEIGAHRLSSAQAAYNYQLELGSGVLSLGVGAGWQQWTLRGGDLRTPDGQYIGPGTVTHNDDILNLATDSGSTLEFSTGVFYQSERFETGLSVENLAGSSIQLPAASIQLQRAYHAFARTNMEVGNDLLLQPSLWIRSDGIENQMDISLLVTYRNNIVAGTSFRGYNKSTQDALVVMGGVQLSPALQLVYAYDITLSPLKTVQSGSHEIVVKYRLQKSIGVGKPPRIIYHPRAKS